MSRIARLVCAALLALSASPPARAGDGGGAASCGRPSYTTSGFCHFQFRGLPIRVFAESSVTTGTARVNVWVTISYLPQTGTNLEPAGAVVLRCERAAATGNKYVNCGAALPSDTTPNIESLYLGQAYLGCHVSSNGTGSFYCRSASGT